MVAKIVAPFTGLKLHGWEGVGIHPRDWSVECQGCDTHIQLLARKKRITNSWQQTGVMTERQALNSITTPAKENHQERLMASVVTSDSKLGSFLNLLLDGDGRCCSNVSKTVLVNLSAE